MVKKLFFLAALLSAGFAGHSQRVRIPEGEITYKVSYTKLTEAMRQLIDVLPSTMTVWFRNNMYCSEVMTPASYSKTIVDARNRDIAILAHVSGRKILVRKAGYRQDEARQKYFIEKTNETKVIAGFTCHKAHVTILYLDNSTEQSDIWYNEEIGSPDFAYEMNYPDIKGIIMEYSLKQEGIEMIYTVTKVEGRTIDKRVFSIPESGYEEMTERQFMHLMNK